MLIFYLLSKLKTHYYSNKEEMAKVSFSENDIIQSIAIIEK